MLTLVVTGKDHADLKRFLLANADADGVSDLRLVVPPKGMGQAAIANHAKSTALEKVVGIVHADTTFQKGDLKALAAAAVEGISGIVGARLLFPGETWDKKFVWGKDLEKPQSVSTLDGCAVFFRRDLPVMFDESFQGWHCVVEDFCVAASEKGIPVVVAPGKASHAGNSTFQPDWQKQYMMWKEKLLRKWSGRKFETT